MKRAFPVLLTASVASLLLAPSVGCGAAPASPANGPAAAAVAAPPEVELRDANGAVVAGHAIPMDGVAEGLAWPALRAALARKAGDHSPLTVAIARGVPTSAVLRVVWTLRDADLRLQTPDGAGAVHVLDLRPKPEAADASGERSCHVAVFVGASGAVRIAAPDGPHTLTGAAAAEELARVLASERGRCSLRYVAFGAEAPDAAWGSVFDVAEAVDRDKSAGDARYVLGEPIHQGR